MKVWAWGWVLIFALALSTRWAYALSFPANVQLQDVDARGYQALALNLLNGHGFSLNTEPPYVPDAIRTPAYPLLVAFIYAIGGRNPLHVALVQGVIDSFTALLLTRLVARLVGRPRWGLVAGGLYALNPTAWRFCNDLLTEIPLAFTLTLMLWTFVRYLENRRGMWLVFSGGLTGLALLIKPNVILLPAILGLAVVLTLLRRDQTMQVASGKWKVAGGKLPATFHLPLAIASLPILVALLLVFPWMVRNRIVFGRWFLSQAFESNLARVSAVATLIHVQGEQVAPWTPRWEAIYSGIILQAQARYGADFISTPRTGPEADRAQIQLASVATDILHQHPRDFLLAHLEGFLRSWVPQEHRFWYQVLGGRSWESLGSEEGVLGQALERFRSDGASAALAFVWQARIASLPPLAFSLWLGWIVATLISAVLSVRGLWRFRDQPAFVCLCLATIFYVTFLPGPIAYIRFQVPVAPMFIVFVVGGLAPRSPFSLSTAGIDPSGLLL